jgi:hypothetical protein
MEFQKIHPKSGTPGLQHVDVGCPAHCSVGFGLTSGHVGFVSKYSGGTQTSTSMSLQTCQIRLRLKNSPNINAGIFAIVSIVVF